jgi:hypothetical protein
MSDFTAMLLQCPKGHQEVTLQWELYGSGLGTGCTRCAGRLEVVRTFTVVPGRRHSEMDCVHKVKAP